MSEDKEAMFDFLTEDEKRRSILMMENIYEICADWKAEKVSMMEALIEICNNVQSMANLVENNQIVKRAKENGRGHD